jgi:uncharacterized protein (DUF1330 family)
MSARLLLPLLLLAAAPPPIAAPTTAQPAANPVTCDNRPVVMVVEGTIRDAKRLSAYAAAIRASGLYQKLGGYYLVNPRPIAVFEGNAPPERSVIAVRFPCLAHARAFWNSRQYQETIVPLRSNPSAGDFIVTVHLELPAPEYMAGRVASDAFVPGTSSMAGIDQVEKGDK